MRHPTSTEALAVKREQERHEGIAESVASEGSACDWQGSTCLTRAKLKREVASTLDRLRAVDPGDTHRYHALTLMRDKARRDLMNHHCEPEPLPTHEEIMAAVRAYGAACDDRASATATEYRQARFTAERTYADLSHKVARLIDAESSAAPSLTTACAWCKWCVRDGKRVPTSHGICEACSEEHFGETRDTTNGG